MFIRLSAIKHEEKGYTTDIYNPSQNRGQDIRTKHPIDLKAAWFTGEQIELFQPSVLQTSRISVAHLYNQFLSKKPVLTSEVMITISIAFDNCMRQAPHWMRNERGEARQVLFFGDIFPQKGRNQWTVKGMQFGGRGWSERELFCYDKVGSETYVALWKID